MKRMDFHHSILGGKASEKLKNLDGCFLTIRSRPFVGDRENIEVFLDNNKLGVAEASCNGAINLGSLTLTQAILGGFNSVQEQENALRKAGYRFKPLNQYNAYQILIIGHWGEDKVKR